MYEPFYTRERRLAIDQLVAIGKRLVPGLQAIGCEYSGSGDEGFVDQVYIRNSEGKRTYVRDDKDENLEEQFYDLVDEIAPSGWETGDGYSGSLEIDVATRRITGKGGDRED